MTKTTAKIRAENFFDSARIFYLQEICRKKPES